MSDQIMNCQDLRRQLLNELEANKQAIESLSDEELEAIAGGVGAAAIGGFVKNNWKALGAGAIGTVGAVSLAVDANANQKMAKTYAANPY